jgi:hypothetical protein
MARTKLSASQVDGLVAAIADAAQGIADAATAQAAADAAAATNGTQETTLTDHEGRIAALE